MKFSFEVPIHSIHQLDDCQNYIFILAHHLDNKEYYEYVRNSKKYKILDNGAYELGESIPPKKLLELGKKLKVNVIILPDKIFDLKRGNELEKEFFEEYFKQNEKFKLMKVVCGNSAEEYLENLLYSSKNENYDILGLSQSRTNITPNLSYCMNYLIKNNPTFNKKIHLLGLTSPFELLEAKMWKQIESVDTGRPINFAFENLEFPKLKRNMDYKKVSGKDIDTNEPLSIELAKKNIDILKRYYYEAH